VVWKAVAIEENKDNTLKTFVVLCGEEPIGEGTLIFSSITNAINGRHQLADNTITVNINGLRVDKPYEGKGHMSKLVKVMEQYARNRGYKLVTIGVEAKETRNLGIYLHWGYDKFIMHEIEDGELVLYYSKVL